MKSRTLAIATAWLCGTGAAEAQVPRQQVAINADGHPAPVAAHGSVSPIPVVILQAHGCGSPQNRSASGFLVHEWDAQGKPTENVLLMTALHAVHGCDNVSIEVKSCVGGEASGKPTTKSGPSLSRSHAVLTWYKRDLAAFPLTPAETESILRAGGWKSGQIGHVAFSRSAHGDFGYEHQQGVLAAFAYESNCQRRGSKRDDDDDDDDDSGDEAPMNLVTSCGSVTTTFESRTPPNAVERLAPGSFATDGFLIVHTCAGADQGSSGGALVATGNADAVLGVQLGGNCGSQQFGLDLTASEPSALKREAVTVQMSQGAWPKQFAPMSQRKAWHGARKQHVVSVSLGTDSLFNGSGFAGTLRLALNWEFKTWGHRSGSVGIAFGLAPLVGGYRRDYLAPDRETPVEHRWVPNYGGRVEAALQLRFLRLRSLGPRLAIGGRVSPMVSKDPTADTLELGATVGPFARLGAGKLFSDGSILGLEVGLALDWGSSNQFYYTGVGATLSRLSTWQPAWNAGVFYEF